MALTLPKDNLCSMTDFCNYSLPGWLTRLKATLRDVFAARTLRCLIE
jgi:hypothetical protein